MALFEDPPPFKTRFTLEVLAFFRLVRLERETPKTNGHGGKSSKKQAEPRGRIVSTTNLTILNFLLVHFGPLHERTLCSLVAGIQIACSLLAFGVRYGLGSLVYGGERR